MWDAEEDDEPAFARRVDTVCREIGERGRLITPEAVPVLKKSSAGDMPTPLPEPAPAVALGALTHTRARVLTPTPAPAPQPARPPRPAPVATGMSPVGPPVLDPSTVSLRAEHDEPPWVNSQLHSTQASITSPLEPNGSLLSLQLSGAVMLERERAERVERVERERAERAERVERERAERERAERERAERTERAERAERERTERADRTEREVRLAFAFAIGTCTCGLGAAILGVALLTKKA